uniref:Uncharacterized protein n=1 Tax=Steinernema glaseri TaxID=37863 RepID=A0A1I7Z728_9BILA
MVSKAGSAHCQHLQATSPMSLAAEMASMRAKRLWPRTETARGPWEPPSSKVHSKGAAPAGSASRAPLAVQESVRGSPSAPVTTFWSAEIPSASGQSVGAQTKEAESLASLKAARTALEGSVANHLFLQVHATSSPLKSTWTSSASAKACHSSSELVELRNSTLFRFFSPEKTKGSNSVSAQFSRVKCATPDVSSERFVKWICPAEQSISVLSSSPSSHLIRPRSSVDQQLRKPSTDRA